jgi:hexosaminidase
METGIFRILSATTIFVENDVISAENLQAAIQKMHGFKLPLSKKEQSIQIRVKVDTTLAQPADYYRLVVDKDFIEITGKSAAGGFYGTQTLLQSIRKEQDYFMVPQMVVEDYPRFPHRGLLLDCSRHFFSVDVVKKYIDVLAFYKMNVLHWHLTDDQGWRIQIDRYPKLTEIGAWRTEPDGSRYGGFYTKDEIREVVAYAAARHITVIPEIEMPGHTQASLAAYPEYSCIGYGVEVINDWGVFKEIYCAGNEDTFTFLENVLTEVTELFPSEYIHIGGDEAPKYRWEHCPKCQARIKAEGLADAHELQSYFIRRIEKILQAKGRKLIGWDEIMEGGLSPTATVQAWRGVEYGVQAAEKGNKVVLSPTSHSYIDYDLKSIDLARVYSLQLLPKELTATAAANIRGAEVNMWTEHVPNESTLDQKVFPRLLALSEVAWRYDTARQFDAFAKRVMAHYPFLKKWKVDYGAESDPLRLVASADETISLMPGSADLRLKYLINSGNWMDYTEPIKINFTGTLTAQAFRDQVPYGAPVVQQVVNHGALGLPVLIGTVYSENYTGGGQNALTDGLLGTLDFRDGRWQGYFGEHVDATVDLGKVTPIQSVQINAYQYNNAWIFLPKKVAVETSEDGQKWTTLGLASPQAKPEQRGQFIEAFQVKSAKPISARYIRLRAENRMTVPEWHEAAGSNAWLFVDELIVK